MTKKIEVMNPGTGEVIKTLELKTEEQICSLVNKAYLAKEGWADLPLYERGEILYRFADLVEEKASQIGRTLATEMAKPIEQAMGECIDGANLLRAAVERAKHLYGDVLAQNWPGGVDDIVFSKREPIGIIGCIIPYNYPIELTFQKIAPALIMGNAVLVKAPSYNPLAVLSLQKLAVQAGIPADVASFFVCDREASSKGIIENPKVDAISMTGSTAAGIEISRMGAQSLKRLFLELGGNDAFIIFEDADIDKAVDEIIAGRLENNGQVCCACKRFIVHKDIKNQLAEKVIGKIKALKRGSALEKDNVITGLVNEKAAIEVEKQIQRTIDQGAALLYGGSRKGAMIEPAVLTDVTEDMDVASDMEIFGPVIPIIEFETEAEAVAIANNSQYGLSSGIMTSDMQRAFRVGRKLKAGAAVINGSGNYRHLDQPFGGVKKSGIGREGISASLEEFSHLKVYAIKEAYQNK